MRTRRPLDPDAARDLADEHARATRHPGLAALCLVMAALALGGAIGLVSGSVDLGATITNRLPLDSLALGALGLALLVALPMAVAGVLAWRGGPFAAEMCSVAGLLLVVWIVVEAAFVHMFSWLQPAGAGYGAMVVLLGLVAESTEVASPAE